MPIRRKMCVCVGLISLCIFFSGCPGETFTVRGYVHFSLPVVGATLDVISNGQSIHQEENETTESGTFLLEIPLSQAVSSFRLESYGGFVDGVAFDAVLRADVDGFLLAEHTFIDINAVTTLVAAYRDAHPDMALADCIEEVKAFLEIPAEVDIYTDLVAWETTFDPYIFADEWEQSGYDLDAFMNILVAEMDATNETSPFVAPGQEKSIGTYVTVGQTILGKANDVFGGEALGWACSVFGSTEYQTAQQVAIIRAMLDDIKNQLNQISGQLNTIQSSISDLSLQISKMAQMLLTAGEQQSYNTIAAMVSNDVAKINSCMDLYRYIVAHGSSSSDDMTRNVNDLIAAITTKDIPTAVAHIDSVLRGTIPASQGMYQLIDSVLFAKSYDTKHFEELNQIYDYWATVQLNGLLLLVEYNHYKYPAQPARTKAVADSYIASLTAQCDLYLTAVEKQLGFLCGPNETAVSSYHYRYVSNQYQNQFAPLSDCAPLRSAQYRVASTLPRSRATSLHLFANGWDWEYWTQRKPFAENMALVTVINTATDQIYTGRYKTYQYDMSSWPATLCSANTKKRGQFIRCEFIDLPPGSYRVVHSAFNAVYPAGPALSFLMAPQFFFQVSDTDPVHAYLVELWAG